jgi:DNA-binding transcriptional LysR family regulator
MVQSLVDFKNEIVIIAKIVSHPGVRFLPLSREEIVAIAHPEHPLGRQEMPLRQKSWPVKESS